jgi:hypothetical protein
MAFEVAQTKGDDEGRCRTDSSESFCGRLPNQPAVPRGRPFPPGDDVLAQGPVELGENLVLWYTEWLASRYFLGVRCWKGVTWLAKRKRQKKSFEVVVVWIMAAAGY